MEFNKLIELDRLAKEGVTKYTSHRKLYFKLLQDKGKHFVGIIGPRGVGKTITLRQLAVNIPKSFYISMESFDGNMFDTLKKLKEKLKLETFLLDEVHSYNDFDKEIQSVYELLNIKVFFTSSTALSMSKYKNDMSRRVLLKYLYPFSFREYLEFKRKNDIPKLTFDDFINKEIDENILLLGEYFYDYIKGGLMPFALDETDVFALLDNILTTVVYKDIPRINKNITMEELNIINKLIKFIGVSSVDGINYSSIARNLGITKYKAEQYVSLLEQAFIIQVIMPEGLNVLKEPKILLSLPYRLLYQEFDFALGGLREDFFVQTCKMFGKDISYLKSTIGAKTPDYILPDSNIVLEIGGKGKGRSQFKGMKFSKKIILADSYEYNTVDKKPLFAFGLIEN
ncbi:MAG: AAA family ATPase [Endomicrobium sp.]|jgi:predicted AAA+ superfamily ATPase|nr:AAA family ATPase [Endomicrobium sp.]